MTMEPAWERSCAVVAMGIMLQARYSKVAGVAK